MNWPASKTVTFALVRNKDGEWTIPEKANRAIAQVIFDGHWVELTADWDPKIQAWVATCCSAQEGIEQLQKLGLLR